MEFSANIVKVPTDGTVRQALEAGEKIGLPYSAAGALAAAFHEGSREIEAAEVLLESGTVWFAVTAVCLSGGKRRTEVYGPNKYGRCIRKIVCRSSIKRAVVKALRQEARYAVEAVMRA